MTDITSQRALNRDTMTTVSVLLNGLNEQQLSAVLHESGPAVVLAGAGSGKTKVLTTHAAWLIREQAIRPEEILLVTFTNKAAEEMNKRVMSLAGFRLQYSGTFHSLCAKILRVEAPHLNLSRSYTIYDSSDQQALLKQLYSKYSWDTKRYKPNAVKGTISQAKNEMLSPNDYATMANDDYQEFVTTAYRYYQQALTEQEALDFDDLLLLAVQLFREHPDVLEKYQTQLKHVLVDEYQDTNKAQYYLTKFLSKQSHNLYVVGDFSQSIYAWRGADYRNLLHLKQDYKDLKEYRLEQNYRSTPTILQAATQVIASNSSHPVLELWTENTQQEKIQVIETNDSETEAYKVADFIRNECSEYDYRDIAILYRTNAQSRAFEEAFIRRGIPYRLVGGTKFYERKEIKDVLAYLRVLVNPHDTVSYERAEKNGKRRLNAFTSWANDKAISLEHEPPLGLLEQILEVTQFFSTMDPKDPQDAARIENVRELVNVAAQFDDVTVFLENIALVQDGFFHDVENQDTPNMVSLMSLHSAKGLEFKVVFMVGMEEGLLPHSQSLWDKEQMEEERRLCYVGITRAREKLFLTYARKRWQYGQSSFTTRSRFISEIDSDLLYERRIMQEFEPATPPNRFGFKKSAQEEKSWLKKVQHPSGDPNRTLVFDEDSLDALLNDEIDINEFLER